MEVLRMRRERCWKFRCLIAWEGCSVEWLGPDRREMWAVCSACGKRRVFLTHFDQIERIESLERRMEEVAPWLAP